MQELTAKRAIITGLVIGFFIAFVDYVVLNIAPMDTETGEIFILPDLDTVLIYISSPVNLILRAIWGYANIHPIVYYGVLFCCPLVIAALIGYDLFICANKTKKMPGLIELVLRIIVYYVFVCILLSGLMYMLIRIIQMIF